MKVGDHVRIQHLSYGDHLTIDEGVVVAMESLFGGEAYTLRREDGSTRIILDHHIVNEEVLAR